MLMNEKLPNQVWEFSAENCPNGNLAKVAKFHTNPCNSVACLPIHTNSLFWVILEKLPFCYFPPPNTSIRGKDSQIYLILHLNILVFRTNWKQPHSFPVLSRFCDGLLRPHLQRAGKCDNKMTNFVFTNYLHDAPNHMIAAFNYILSIYILHFYLPRPLLNPLAPGGLVISIHCILCDFFQTVDHNFFNLNQPLLHHSLQNHQCKKLSLITWLMPTAESQKRN